MTRVKTRVAYGYLKSTDRLIMTEDTVKEALRANMMVRDYEKELIRLNPQLDIKIIIE